MILSCPECTARFMVPDDALRPNGRKVKCGKCAHSWLADPPPVIEEDEGDLAPVSITPLEPDELSPMLSRNLPAMPVQVQSRATLVAWGLLVVMLAVLLSVLWFGRDQLVAAVPAVQPVYQSIGLCVGIADPERSFSFASKPKPSRAESGELVINGEVTRDSACATYVPDIIVEFLDTERNVLQRTVFPLEVRELPASQAVPFALKIDRWPDNIADINLLFTIPNVKS